MHRLALAVALICGVASADHDPRARGFDAIPFKLTPFRGGAVTEGVSAGLPGALRVSFFFDLAGGILPLRVGAQHVGELIPWRLDAHLIGAYQLSRRWEVGADLPLVLAQADNLSLLGELGFPQPGVRSFVPGDLRLFGKVLALDAGASPLGVAGVLEVRLPTGDEQSFAGDLGVVLAPRIAVERTVGPVRLVANLGVRLRYHAQFLNLYVGNEYTFGASAAVKLPDWSWFTRTEALLELNASTPTEAPFTFAQADSLKTPISFLVGARARVRGPIGAFVFAGRGLGPSGYGRESFRIIAGVRYALDRADRDGDGIPDDYDQCPDEPEDVDGFQDGDGCPDPDNDNDGIPDVEDACPNDKGPREMDGCPDTDGDEIPDHVDRCPTIPGEPQFDGCDEAGPLVELEADRIRLRGNIRFEVGEARIQKRSFRLLDEIYGILKTNPNVGPVVIEGHTDNRGSRAINVDLSTRRARAVLEYLVKKGIARERLRSFGYGFAQPIADNDTALGRTKNRRVEFRLLRPSELEQFDKAAAEAATPPPPPAEPPPAEPKPAEPKPAEPKPVDPADAGSR